MVSTVVATFLKEVETLLKAGNAGEHSYRPALVRLFDAVLAPATAINEPKQAAYGAPDIVIQRGNAPIGHIEAKDIGIDLGHVIADSEKAEPKTTNGKQLKRYRAALPNLLYTDEIEWHWFVDGTLRQLLPVVVAKWEPRTKSLQRAADAEKDLTALLNQFASHDALTISTPQDLARRLAQIARWLDDLIGQVFGEQGNEGSLHQQLAAFRKTLLPNLTPAEFADMYAQTLVDGLFAARRWLICTCSGLPKSGAAGGRGSGAARSRQARRELSRDGQRCGGEGAVQGAAGWRPAMCLSTAANISTASSQKRG